MTDIIEHLPNESLPVRDSGNVSLSSSLEMKSVDEVDNVGYRFESERLRSFENWPVPYIEPEKLAAAGFYYLGEGDKVKCFECNIEICQWVENDDPMEDHKRWSSKCRFIKKQPCGNVPIGADPNTIPPVRSSLDVCGIYHQNSGNDTLTAELQLLSTAKLNAMGLGRTKGPLHPDFVSYDARLKTFDTWPRSMPQTKEHLAHAGFHYTGNGDQTLCYHCGGGLKDWEPEDDPWEEHAKWFPKCCYLLMVKGQEYVNKVTGQQTSPISTEEALQMNLPSFIKTIEPLSSDSGENGQIENAPGPSHRTESGLKVEGSTSEEIKGCKDFNSTKAHCSKSVDDARVCKICYNGELGVVFLPCGHMVACVDCAPEMTTCAVCRVHVAMKVRAFLS
ncbi:putative inhibitor of apoptosis [Vespula pensylvanica]|uniref:RING-type domain-containing protein n=1 Tax=Vespula pensylvanica TaxID=30213 RepID=A0A834NBE8_VESPE|nr:putative inhibitor of apoptosis [Vespula pensylvanica]KAF7401959.1 hypothetical protein H0235_015295 [Vespula pensylvanica]